MEKDTAKVEKDGREIDPRTEKLLILFQILNCGQPLDTGSFGQLPEDVAMAALVNGIRRGEINIIWENDRFKDLIPEVHYQDDPQGTRVVVEINEHLLRHIEFQVNAKADLIKYVERLDSLLGWILKHKPQVDLTVDRWQEVKMALTAAHKMYRSI